MRSVVEVNSDYARQVESKLSGLGVRCDKLVDGTFQVRSSMTKQWTEDQIIFALPNCDITLESDGEGCKGTVRFDGVAVMNE